MRSLAVAAGGGLALYMVAILWAVAGFVGMIVGIVVAVLLLRLLWRTMDPVAPAAFRNEGKQFIAAWEGRFGEMRPGLRATQPPPGSFQRWLADHRRTGVPAGDWIDAHMQRGAGLAIRAEDRLVRGHCRLGRTLLTDPEPPPMGLVADPTHLRLYNIDGPEFVRVTWSAIREVERTEEGWLLYFDLESKEPNDRFVATNFYAMTVSSVDDPQRFHGLLRDHGFRWQHTDIDLEGVQPDDD